LKGYNDELTKMHLDLGNIFGHISMAAAYRGNEEWLRALISYIEKNIDFAYGYVGKELSGVTFIKPQSSFLLWLDFRNVA